MEEKIRKESPTYNMMTELVLPNDTNTLGNLMGGRMMYWMDIGSAISAMRLSNSPVVTASVDNVSFNAPIKLGHILTVESFVTRAFNTSMEVRINVHGEDKIKGLRYLSNTAYFTFVALDLDGKPKKVREVNPETEWEQELYEGALRRRQLRLILAGKMQAQDADELKSLFLGTK